MLAPREMGVIGPTREATVRFLRTSPPIRPTAIAIGPSSGWSPTGRREAPPDDRLSAIRESINAGEAAPDFAALHPGYGSPTIEQTPPGGVDPRHRRVTTGRNRE